MKTIYGDILLKSHFTHTYSVNILFFHNNVIVERIYLPFKHMHMEIGGVNGVDDKSIMFGIPGWSVIQVFGDSGALFCQNFKGST